MTGFDLVTSVPLPHSRDARFCHDWSARKPGVLLQEADDFWHCHEAVRVITGVSVSRQTALPAGRQETKRVPPLRQPRVGHLTALEDHVVDRTGAEMPARGQSGLAGADNDGGRELHGTRSFPAVVLS